MDTGLGAKAYSIIEQGKIGMILSSRPTDRRQLIEEAAGVTKYKSRRRAAELKLDAAQQNLTRLDDIVFEVEKQCGSLKRQAAKARRYQRLRDEMRRWEKVLFARRYRHLAEHIESARARLHDARQDEAASTARLAEVETELARVRLELAAGRAGRHRASARTPTPASSTSTAGSSSWRSTRSRRRCSRRASPSSKANSAALDERREPDRLRLEERRDGDGRGGSARDAAADGAAAWRPRPSPRRSSGIAAAEQAVERARGDVYAVINTVTALTTAIEHAASERERSAAMLGRLEVEAADLRRPSSAGRSTPATAPPRCCSPAQSALHATLASKAAREADLAAARGEHEWRERDRRASASTTWRARRGRLRSLEEMDASRAAFGDGARMLLAGPHDAVGQHGALADYLDVDSRYERAVEAALGDLLQHVVVDDHAQAHAGFALVRSQGAGRCGFIVTGDAWPRAAGGGAGPARGRRPAVAGGAGERPVRAQPAPGDRRGGDRRHRSTRRPRWPRRVDCRW